MLIILKDPAGVLGRQRHEWDLSKSLQANIAEHLASGAGCTVTINGQEVDPLTDPRLDAPPSAVDSVIVTRRPQADPITWLYIGYAALAAYTLVSVRNASSASSTTAKDSPNNSLTAQTNRARTYQAIPDVYGYRRVWPDMIQPSVVEYIDHIKYVTEWLCISRGRGDITAVQYAETPIGDIAGASYEVFTPAGSSNLPELSTTTLSDVLETFASDEVDGQEMQPAVPYPELSKTATIVVVDTATTFTVQVPDGSDLAQLKGVSPSGTARVYFEVVGAGGGEGGDPAVYFDETCTVLSYVVSGGQCTFTFSSSPWDITEGVRTYTSHPVLLRPNGSTYYTIGPYTLPLMGSRIRWNTVFLRGLRGTVTIYAEWWQIDAGGTEIGGTREGREDSYSSYTYDQQFFTRDATPSAGYGRYRIRFIRLSTQIGDGSADVAKLEELYAVRHYPTKVLPGVTVIRITTKATAEATGLSDRKFNLRWLRHVRVLHNDYDIGPTRNFTRAMGHMWTLAGNPLSELDTDKLAAISAELGADSPLARFDASLDDSDVSLGSRMQMAADAARCTMWRDGQKWTVTRDQLRSYPELQLDYRNLAASGESSISYAAHLPASNDGVEVEYVDETTQAKKSYVRLNISGGGVSFGESANPLKIKMQACATYSQALNRGLLEARKLLFQRVTVSDTALNDAGSLGLGSLVRWIDPNDFAGDDGLQAGEVMAITGSQILTSEPLDWKGEPSGRITFTGANGQRLGAPVVCTPAAGGAVTLASVPGGLYVRNGTTRQLGSRYAFAVGLTEAEVESAGLYLVTSLKPDGKGGTAVTLAEYDARVYADD